MNFYNKFRQPLTVGYPLAQILHYSEFHKTRHCSRGFAIRRVLSAALLSGVPQTSAKFSSSEPKHGKFPVTSKIKNKRSEKGAKFPKIVYLAI
jgi:hypothetical protein